MRNLSKSKLLAFRQCPKRLWLEINRPEERDDSAATQANFAVGHQVGDIARRLYDAKGKGVLIDVGAEGYDAALARSRALLKSSQPIFEAGFSSAGALAFADVMLPVKRDGKRAWRMIEVKSSTSVKDYHRDDAAVQAYVARQAKVPLASIALAHIDSSWVYPGGEDYQGLLVENDLTDEAFARSGEVKGWIAEAQAVLRKGEPDVRTGRHCGTPYGCGFLGYCARQEPQAKYPVAWLPRIQTRALKSHIEENGVTEMEDVPDGLLNETQMRVKQCTLSGTTYFNSAAAAADLRAHKLPAYFLDFETIQFAVPIWKGTRPYQQIPFQFSLHRLNRNGKLEHQSFLDLSGEDPSRAFAASLIGACGEKGPIFAFNAPFEKARVKELAERSPKQKQQLQAIAERLVDLLPVAQAHYYNPSQEGSWSIKKVLPAVAPDLNYDALDGVQDGGMAMEAYLEALDSATSRERKAQIQEQLAAYCGLDTYAMVRLWQFFAGRGDLQI